MIRKKTCIFGRVWKIRQIRFSSVYMKGRADFKKWHQSDPFLVHAARNPSQPKAVSIGIEGNAHMHWLKEALKRQLDLRQSTAL